MSETETSLAMQKAREISSRLGGSSGFFGPGGKGPEGYEFQQVLHNLYETRSRIDQAIQAVERQSTSGYWPTQQGQSQVTEIAEAVKQLANVCETLANEVQRLRGGSRT